jgi:hypothetical protein
MKLNILLLLVLLLYVSCKDDCKNQTSTSADFDIETLFSDFTKDEYINVVNDTVRKGATVRFKAKDSTATYEWQLGTDPRKFTNQTVSLEFDVEETIQVRLIVKKAIDKQCFPNDDGIDTVQKSFVVVDQTFAPIGVGQVLEGSVTSRPTEVFQIVLRDDLSVGPFLDNFPNGCIRPFAETSRGHIQVHTVNYRHFRFGDLNNLQTNWPCPIPCGWGEVAKDHTTIKLYYQIKDFLQQKVVQETFIGKIKQ